MLFLVLFVMLVISSVLSSIGTLFLSEDLELVLSSPISPWRLFWSKFMYVYIVSSWMPLIFIAPVLIAIGQVYHASFWYYAVSGFLLAGWFAIPAALGLLAGVLLVMLIPVYRVREMLIVLFLTSIAGLFMLFQTISLHWNVMRSAGEMLRIVSLMTTADVWWLPSNWLARGIQELLQSGGSGWHVYGTALYFSAAALLSLAYMAIYGFQDQAYSMARNKRRRGRVGSSRAQKALRAAGAFLSPPFRGILGKEARVLSRDIAQAVQVLLLLGLALIYLYNMRVFSAVDSFPESVRPWWKSFMFLGNVCMGAFITTAFCTRFVYPSISLEGRAFWVLQTSPLQMGEIMRVKFWTWLVPVALVSVIFFASGAVVIGAEPVMILVSAASSLLVCYAIVGLALGIGAMFAHFDWEHSSQLAAGFGSFIFMLCAIVLIFANMFPAWLLLTVRSDFSFRFPAWLYLYVAMNLLAVGVLNYFVASIVMKKGERALVRMMSR